MKGAGHQLTENPDWQTMTGIVCLGVLIIAANPPDGAK